MRLLAYVIAVSCVAAQTGKLAAGKQANIESAIAKFMAESKAPGIPAAVVQDGEFVWSAGFGMADLENSVPATSSTLYRLGSISKPLTATAAMALWDHGKLDLDSPVQKYCPAFPEKEWPINTRELLGHLGGIRSTTYLSNPTRYPRATLKWATRITSKMGLMAASSSSRTICSLPKPGTHFTYSTQGYTVVGCAIEGASGKKYADYVRENVLIPAGMLQARPDDRFALISHRTRFYSKDKSGAVVNAEFLDSSYKVPGGGLLSSAEDMARFEVAILANRLVTSKTREMMWTPQEPSDGLGRMVYGLGWGVGTTEGVRDVGHGGSQQGTSAMMLIAPNARAGVVVLINSDAAGANALGSRLLKIMLGLPAGEPNQIPVNPKLYDGYIGKYKLDGFAVTIVRENDDLFALIRDQKIGFFPRGFATISSRCLTPRSPLLGMAVVARRI